MKHRLIITAMLSCMLLFGAYGIVAAGNSPISLEQALKHGTIRVHLKANSTGHMGECITMNLTNCTNVQGYYVVEAGRRLKCSDTGTQDILITREENIVLAPHHTRSVKLFGFCCQAHNAGPDSEAYSIGRMASAELVAIARFLNRHIGFEFATMQQAVWCVSDDEPLSSVRAVHMETLKGLLDTLSRITGQPVPSLTATTYSPGDTYIARTNNAVVTVTTSNFTSAPRSTHLYTCDLRYSIANSTVVTINVYDATGVKLLSYSQVAPGDGNALPVSFDTKGWNKGKYTICVFTDSITIARKEIKL